MRKAFIALALLTGSTAAAQQPRQAPQPEDVIVIGRSDADREQQIRDFVRSLSDAPGDGPLARFDTAAVCPAAVGLREEHNRTISQRMRRVAQAAGITLAAPGCRPNVLVIVTRDPQAMIAALRKQHPVFFRHASGRPVDIPKQTGSAVAWHLEGRLDRDGVPVVADRIEQYDVIEATDTASRLAAASRPIFMASVVVIDLDALAGLTPVQVADYAAMRAFVRADPARAASSRAPTILTALDAPMGTAVAQTLTSWDLSYLRGYYGSQKLQAASRQRAEIQRRMKKDLDPAPRADD